MLKRYTNNQINVPIKLIVATNRKKCVPPLYAGDAKPIHKIPNICNKQKKILFNKLSRKIFFFNEIFIKVKR